MRDLENGPRRLVALLSLVRLVLGVLHLVSKLQQHIFNLVEPGGWELARAFPSDCRRHFAGLFTGGEYESRRRVGMRVDGGSRGVGRAGVGSCRSWGCNV